MKVYQLAEENFQYLKAKYQEQYPEDGQVQQARDIAELIIALKSHMPDNDLVFSVLKLLASR